MFILHPARVVTHVDGVSRTIAHRCHDECVDVGEIDAGRRTVLATVTVVIDALRPSSMHKREVGRISIGDRGVLMQRVARTKWRLPIELIRAIVIEEILGTVIPTVINAPTSRRYGAGV